MEIAIPMNQPTTSESDAYAEFVEHPRYGRGPRFTGLDLNPLDPLSISTGTRLNTMNLSLNLNPAPVGFGLTETWIPGLHEDVESTVQRFQRIFLARPRRQFPSRTILI